MNRRRFLRLLLAVLGSTAIVSLTYPFVRFLAPPGAAAKAQKLALKKDEIPVGEAKNVIFNSVPTLVINRPGKGFIAISKVCTHLGCLVEYEKEKNRLLCPCHAGIFDLEGNVVSGPPPAPLTKFPVLVEGENVVIG